MRTMGDGLPGGKKRFMATSLNLKNANLRAAMTATGQSLVSAARQPGKDFSESGAGRAHQTALPIGRVLHLEKWPLQAMAKPLAGQGQQHAAQRYRGWPGRTSGSRCRWREKKITSPAQRPPLFFLALAAACFDSLQQGYLTRRWRRAVRGASRPASEQAKATASKSTPAQAGTAQMAVLAGQEKREKDWTA